MPEFNPNNPEVPKPLSLEEIEALRRAEELREQQEKAAEFADAKEAEATGVPFKSPHTSDHLVERAENTGLKPEVPKPEPTETGLKPEQQAKLEKDPVAWVNEAISDPKLSAYEKLVGMSKAQESHENLDKDKAA